MYKYLLIFFTATSILFNSYSNGQTTSSNNLLTASEFSEKIKDLPEAPIIDVRTDAEFEKGHLKNALNFNWNGNDFQKQVATLDKDKAVFVYCLSGGRSSAAVNSMRTAGFKEIYELRGGIMKWRADNLPETTAIKTASGMSKEQFYALTNSDKLVLIDFYAVWCAPCKKMEPYLNEISKDMADKVKVIRINADDNQQLCKELKIDALPVLQVYKNKTMRWTNTGYISKEDVLKQLK